MISLVFTRPSYNRISWGAQWSKGLEKGVFRWGERCNNVGMIIIKFIFIVLGVIFLLGLLGGLVLMVSMFSLRKRMEKAFKDARNRTPGGENGDADEPHIHVEGDVEMVKCPHCGTFTDANDPKCEACGQRL